MESETAKNRPGDRSDGRRAEDTVTSLLREAGAGITQGLLVVDGDRRVVFVNRPYRIFFKLADDDPHGQPGIPLESLLRHHAEAGEYGPGSADQQVAERIAPVLARQDWALDRRQRDGRYLNITGNALPSGGYVYTFTDVTDRVREKERLDALVQERTAALADVNRQLVEGIEYARLIQRSTMPSEAVLREAFADHFVLFRPYGIVGGDFYFCIPRDYGVYFGVADCTGHGVPGALMTMLASAVMRRAVNEVGRQGPAAVIESASQLTRINLGQGPAPAGHDAAAARAPDNGFDVSLCLLEQGAAGRERLRFAGAGLGLVWQAGGRLEEVQGRRGGIGYARSQRGGGSLGEVTLEVEKVERLFFTTDGLYDQPGEPNGFGFGCRRWIDALALGLDQGLRGQCEGAVAKLEAFAGERGQRDDVTFLAVDLTRDPVAGTGQAAAVADSGGGGR